MKKPRTSFHRLKQFLNEEASQLGPVLSVVAMVGTLLFLVFLQMEERRLGYGVLKLSRIYREKLDDKHYKEIALARSLRLEKMESLAQRKLTLQRVNGEQVIHLNEISKPVDKNKIVAPPLRKATTSWLECQATVAGCSAGDGAVH